MKTIIANKFNKAASSYDQVSQVQYYTARSLVDHIKQAATNLQANSILDIGAGTGHTSELILKLYPNAKFTLMDISQNMLNIAKNKLAKFNNISYQTDDIETTAINKQNIIASNFCFQWLANLPTVLDKLCINSDLLAFSCLLDGTFKSWYNLLGSHNLDNHALKYPTKQELINLCDHQAKLHGKSLITFEQSFILDFARPFDAIQYLKKLGATGKKVQYKYKNIKSIMLSNENCTLNYEVIYVLIGNI